MKKPNTFSLCPTPLVLLWLRLRPENAAGPINCTDVTAVTVERCDGKGAVFVFNFGDESGIICGEEQSHTWKIISVFKTYL